MRINDCLSPLKIFLAATSLRTAYGGPAYSVSRLARSLSDYGHQVALWSADSSSPSIDTNSQNFAGTMEQALNVFGSPHVVHDNGIWLSHNHALAKFARERRIPRILSTRGMLEPWARKHKRLKKSIAWRLYQRRDIASATRLHATSATEAANLKLLGIDVAVSVIPNGVDIPEPFESTTENKTLIRTALFVGRLYPVKGLPILLDAWSRTRPVGWKLIIAGPDESGHRRDLEKKIRAARLDDDISFAGPVSGETKRALYRDAQLFVLPTYSESFGVAIAEALAHSLPVLTTTSAPWPDLESRGCGWLADPTVESLSKRLLDATNSPAEELLKMGSVGRAYVADEFSWDRVAKEFTNLYESLINAA